MRTGIYAVLAVVVGVMLVGLLPGQLSNFAAPAVVQTPTLHSGAAPESTLNKTSTAGDTVVTGRGFSNSSAAFVITTPNNSSGFEVPSTSTAALTASIAATGTTIAADAAATASQAAGTKSDAASTVENADRSYNPYADLGYYAMWGVGLVAALSVYFVSKRMLG